MAEYVLTAEGVQERSSEQWIPSDPRNKDWRKYLDWVNDGNTADPMPVVPPVPISDKVENGLMNNPALAALVRRTAKAEGITERALLDEIRAEAQEV
jgi:hypothetical protein